MAESKKSKKSTPAKTPAPTPPASADQAPAKLCGHHGCKRTAQPDKGLCCYHGEPGKTLLSLP